MGNMVADAMRAKYPGVDAAYTNSGGLRQDLVCTPPSAGEADCEITWGEMFSVLPFGNRSVILTLTAEAILEAAEQPGKKDYKTQLQELTARLALGTPVYQIDGSGPDHDKRFTAVTLIDGIPRGHGAGTSKKRAEQVAARSAYSAVLTSVAKEDGSNGQT